MQIQPTIFISASFVPSLLVGYRKVYSARCEADCRYHISWPTAMPP